MFSDQLHQACLDALNSFVNVPLIYYTHIPISIVSFLLGLFVFIKNRDIVGKSFFALSFAFSSFLICNLVTWLSLDYVQLSFFWSFFGMLISAIFVLSFYFAYAFYYEHDLSSRAKLALLAAILPILVLTPTNIDLKYFDGVNCTPIENAAFMAYYYSLGVFSFLAILYVFFRQNRSIKDAVKKRRNFLFFIGIETFILLFTFSSFLVSYLNDIGYLSNYNYEQYGFIGAIVFLSLISYIIVKFKAFNIKLLGAQALVWALVVLIGSEFLFVTSITNKILVALTLVTSSILGLLLIRGVKKEIAQREKIEALAKDLQVSNEELASANIRLKELDQQKSEFVSLASHQLRSPLAAIKGYASMMIEGDYGALPAEISDPLSKIYESVKSMIIMVEDFLSVSRIEQGRMKFDFTDFDMKKLTEEVVGELKPNAEKKGLALSFAAEPGKKFLVNGDQTKIKQTVINFLDNSIKYTPTGSIKVSIKRNAYDKILVAISDTGVGISPETMPRLFNKFTRAADANKTNVQGTGLGLYVAKQMIEANKGRVWAESEGEGKGSTFFIELQGK